MTTRIALVTGGVGGIGSEICVSLASAGLKVIACDLPRATALDSFNSRMNGLDVHFEACDASDFGDCQRLVQRVSETYGDVSVLVNAAGITRDVSLRKMDPEQWHEVLRVNLDSVFNLCRLLADGMCQRGYGRIVNISSIVGQTGAFGQTNYAAAKAGMHGFTMALARELAAKGVTVNSVSPGYIETAMTAAIPAQIREQMIGAIPAARIGQPRDVANAVAFLCAEETGYLTGINLPVNGGLYMSF